MGHYGILVAKGSGSQAQARPHNRRMCTNNLGGGKNMPEILEKWCYFSVDDCWRHDSRLIVYLVNREWAFLGSLGLNLLPLQGPQVQFENPI